MEDVREARMEEGLVKEDVHTSDRAEGKYLALYTKIFSMTTHLKEQ